MSALPPRSHAPYPSNLAWRTVMSRLFFLNLVMVAVGALSMHATEVMDDKLSHPLGLPYYFLWMACIGMAGYVFNGCGMLLVGRRAWRLMPDAETRYARAGLYRGLPAIAKAQLAATAVLTVMLAAGVSQLAFVGLTHAIDAAWLPRKAPPFNIALFDISYGIVLVYAFEYLQDRAALSEARERMAQQLSTQAQLNLLRSQLDPHMLFNTLSNLYGLIDESPEQARTMLSHLIAFLRATLAGSRVTQHALAEEFKLAADYLALMQIRMGERLRVEMSLPDHIRHAIVPAMLLQPLVENAVKHGLEPRKEGGSLTVTADVQDGQLVLRVSNCGLGHGRMPVVQILAQPTGGFGLHYVRDRLQALYGEAARMDFTQHEGRKLTQVTLQMPLRLSPTLHDHPLPA